MEPLRLVPLPTDWCLQGDGIAACLLSKAAQVVRRAGQLYEQQPPLFVPGAFPGGLQNRSLQLPPLAR